MLGRPRWEDYDFEAKDLSHLLPSTIITAVVTKTTLVKRQQTKVCILSCFTYSKTKN
jgi:hypothetical protein